MKSIFKIIMLICTVSTMSIFFSCNNNTSATTSPTAKTGYFIDGPVKGLKYLTSSGLSGTTDKNGAFQFETGDTIKFMISSLQLGDEVECDEVLTPLELCGATELISSPEATNMVRFLMSFDNGDNPYGLTLPDEIHTNFDTTTNTSLTGILSLSEDDFKTTICEIYEDVTGTVLESTSIPDATEANEHFNLSMELVDSLVSSNGTDNMFLTVKLPVEQDEGNVEIMYHIDEMPEGITSYTSGGETYSNNKIASFREFMYTGNWTLTVMLKHSENRVSVGDILSFYTSDGFVSTLPTDYSLEITEDTETILQAELSTSGANVDVVHNVSGIVTVPKFLPDNITDVKTKEDSLNFHIFVSIINPVSDETVASFSVRPSLEASNLWIEDNGTYKIGFETDLPSGFDLNTQIYLSVEGSSSERYEIIEFHTLGVLENSVIDCDYVSSEWELIEIRSLTRSLLGINDLEFDINNNSYSFK